jgi:hypothetical protein
VEGLLHVDRADGILEMDQHEWDWRLRVTIQRSIVAVDAWAATGQ